MNARVEFYKIASEEFQEVPEFMNGRHYRDVDLKLKKLSYIAASMGVDDFPQFGIGDDPDVDLTRRARFGVEGFLNKIYADNIHNLNKQIKGNIVALDEPWRQKISSYIAHIRAVLHGEDIEKRLYQSIMNKLNDLQEMVDRHEARVDVAQEIFLDLTRTAGEGAKNLNPVASLGRKLWLAIEKLKGSEGAQPRQLPPPETLGLPDPDDEG